MNTRPRVRVAAPPVAPGRSGRALRVPGIAAAALAVLVAGGCWTGNGALSQRNYTPADGVQRTVGDMKIRNLVLISDGHGATLVGSFANSGSDLANGGATDRLVSVTVDGRPAAFTITDRSLPPLRPLTFGTPDGPQAFFGGATLTPGLSVPVTVVFARAAQVTIQTPVLPRTLYYTAVPTPPAGAPRPTAARTTTLGATPGTPSAPPTGPTAAATATASPGSSGGVPQG